MIYRELQFFLLANVQYLYCVRPLKVNLSNYINLPVYWSRIPCWNYLCHHLLLYLTILFRFTIQPFTGWKIRKKLKQEGGKKSVHFVVLFFYPSTTWIQLPDSFKFSDHTQSEIKKFHAQLSPKISGHVHLTFFSLLISYNYLPLYHWQFFLLVYLKILGDIPSI